MERIITDYTERANYASGQAAKFKKQSDVYSLYRLLAFGGFILCVALAISVNELMIIVAALPVLIIVFAALVKKQAVYDKETLYWLDVKKVNENEITNIQTRANIYPDGAEYTNDKHYYNSDLDIFGPLSLFQLANRAATQAGIYRLARWLSSPLKQADIIKNQDAVKEIAAKTDWRIDFQAHLVFCLKQNRQQVKSLLGYLKIPVEIENEKNLRLYIALAPWILAAIAIASIFYLPAAYAIIPVALLNKRLVSSQAKAIAKTDHIAGKISGTLMHFSAAFRMIENEAWHSELLQHLHTSIKRADGESISSQIEMLSKLMAKLDYRLNLVAGFIMDAVFLWSIKQTIDIEQWKKNSGSDIERAFDVLGQVEALVSLSSLAVNYPDWSFPEIYAGKTHRLSAKAIGHPLINASKRVANDYTLGDANHVDIITGSNMAGKSTFLRTVGVNVVLALAGAPVCAEKMALSVMTVLSYMRIKDALNESTSTFKAEIDRLQMLLKAVEEHENIFFLIDEMLRGTNSVDKYRGSKAVIEKLVNQKAVGIVATHDLQIAKLENEYPGYIRNFYFDIQVVNGEMRFDYKIKPGECTTFNASLLLKQIGIDAV